ncbi:MAG: recombination mediator RecR [Anaplasmataceae bacterium]|nr:recombination mediator RecR [Anaplasmataceae bacterium]
MNKEISQLIRLFTQLPALNYRSATRIVSYLLKKRTGITKLLTNQMTDLMANIKCCCYCNNYCNNTNVCEICSNTNRDNKTICIVEDISSLWAIENAQTYEGVYYVLGGILSISEDTDPDDLAIERLIEIIKNNDATELIMALNSNLEGKTTAQYIINIVNKYHEKGIAVSFLASGVPIGGEIEFLDKNTLIEAINSRKIL